MMLLVHHFNRNSIDGQALEIVRALQSQGFTTYLVGGCIRDLLLGYKPKDFDIVTDALPAEVRGVLPKSYIIGKRFKLVLARRRNSIFEISTFRKDGGTHDLSEREDVLQKKINYNVFGTPKEDAFRRDFTLNALLYDPFGKGIIDYCNGLKHIEESTICMIGDPKIRLKEDPVRILRAIRFSYKLDFVMEERLREAIPEAVGELKHSSIHRIREEFLKILKLKDPSLPFVEAANFGVLSTIAPILKEAFERDDSHLYKALKHFHDFQMDHETPIEFFAAFVLAITREAFQEEAGKDFNEKKLNVMMERELGLFKYEREFILRSLKLLAEFKKIKQYEKSPEKMKLLLKNNAFAMAVFMAQRDPTLPPGLWSFWYEMYTKNSEKL